MNSIHALRQTIFAVVVVLVVTVVGLASPATPAHASATVRNDVALVRQAMDQPIMAARRNICTNGPARPASGVVIPPPQPHGQHVLVVVNPTASDACVALTRLDSTTVLSVYLRAGHSSGTIRGIRPGRYLLKVRIPGGWARYPRTVRFGPGVSGYRFILGEGIALVPDNSPPR